MTKVSQEEREKRRQRLLKSNPNAKRWPKFKADALAAAWTGKRKEP